VLLVYFTLAGPLEVCLADEQGHAVLMDDQWGPVRVHVDCAGQEMRFTPRGGLHAKRL